MDLQVLSQRVHNRLVEVYYKIYEQFPTIQLNFPTIVYKNLGTTAGRATEYGDDSTEIALNHILLVDNVDHFINDTIPHEMAHLVVMKFCPDAKAHGSEWFEACRRLGMKEISVCHDLDTSASRRNITRVEAYCQCMTHQVTLRKARAIKTGDYICQKCKTKVYVP